MNINIILSFHNNQARPFDHHTLQGLIYLCLTPNTHKKIHGTFPWLFCFSNIFTEKSTIYTANKKYHVTVSSIDQEIVADLYEQMLSKKTYPFWADNQITIHTICIVPDEKVRAGKKLQAMTPVVISLDNEVCARFAIDDKREPLYRTKEHGFDVRVHQLHKNLLRKYIALIEKGYVQRLNQWDKELLALYKQEERSLFDAFVWTCNFFSGYKYRRNAVANYKWWYIWWSVWNLVVGDDSNGIKVIKTVLPIGFGERCTAGFGYMR